VPKGFLETAARAVTPFGGAFGAIKDLSKGFLEKGLYRTQSPDVYPSTFGDYKERAGNLLTGASRQEADPYSEAGWSKYLGQDEFQNYIRESEYAPSSAQDTGAKYSTYVNPETNRSLGDSLYDWYKEKRSSNEEIKYPYAANEASGFPEGSALGTFKIDKGRDEIGDYLSVYDEYDFNLPGAEFFGVESIFGKPFEVYDRMYYNPETGKRVMPQEVKEKSFESELDNLISMFR